MRRHEPNVNDLLKENTLLKEIFNDLLEYAEYHRSEEEIIKYLLKNYYDKSTIEYYCGYKPEIIEGVMEDLYAEHDR